MQKSKQILNNLILLLAFFFLATNANLKAQCDNPPTVTITSSSSSVCQGDSATLYAGSWTSVVWYQGWLMQEIGYNDNVTIYEGGLYSVIVTDANGCTAFDTISIMSYSAPLAFISANQATNTCNPDALVLYACCGASFQWINWDNSTLDSLMPYNDQNFTYEVEVWDPNGCTAIASIDITPTQITPEIYAYGPTTFCQGNSVQLTTVNYNSYTSFQWNSGQLSSNILADTTDTYIVTVTDYQGCTGTASIDVTMNLNPTPDITPNITIPTCDASNLILDAGPGYSSYYWYFNATNTETMTPNYNGNLTYAVLVTDANGCTGTGSLDVTVYQSPTPTVTANMPTSVCDPSQLDGLTLDAGSGYASYLWFNWDNSTAETMMPYYNNSYTYQVIVTDNNGCSGVGSIDIIANTQSITPFIIPDGSTTFCDGGSVNLNAGIYISYLWSTGETTETINVTTSNIYYVTVTDQNGCTGSQGLEVDVYSMVAGISSEYSTSFCEGGYDNLYASANPYNPNDTYLWQDGSTDTYQYVTTSGDYSVTITDDLGCSSSALITITVNPNPAPFITSDSPTDLSLCYGDHINFTLDAGQGYVAYDWYTWYNSTTQTITPNQDWSGTYSVMVTDQNGCVGYASLNANIINLPPLNLSITPNGPTTFCQGSSVSLDAGSYSVYSWSTGETSESIATNSTDTYCVTVSDVNGCIGSTCTTVVVNPSIIPDFVPPGTWCAGLNNILSVNSVFDRYSWWDGGNGQTASIPSSGYYCVTVTDGNGCTGSNCIDITINPNPTPIITPSGSTTFCQGGSVSLYAGFYSSYLWSNGETTESITANSTGTYTVTVIDVNGCSSTTSQEVTVNQNPTPEITPYGNRAFCDYADLITGSYASYIWGNGDMGQVTYAASSETLYLTVTDDNGCTGTASYDVVVILSPTPVITGPLAICEGQTATLDAGGPYTSYDWIYGQTTESITVSTEGYYYLTVYNDVCPAWVQTYLTVYPNPTPVITTNGPSSFCEGNSITIDAGGNYSSYMWSDGNTNQATMVTSTGTYIVTVTNANGCTGSDAFNVTVYTNPTPVITSNGPTTFCTGSSVSLDAGSWSLFHWSTGDNTQTISVNSSGTYSVSIADAFGCTGTASINVSVNPNPTTVITGPSSSCSNNPLILNAGSQWSSYHWSNGVNAENTTAASTGTYCVTITNANGCSATACRNVTVNQSPTPSIAGPSSNCTGGVITLTTNPNTSYHWSTGSNLQMINVNISGTYSVTVTNASGCTGVASQTVSITNFLNPIIIGTPTTPCVGGIELLSTNNNYNIYNWSNGATTSTVNVSSNGTYIVTVTTGGCSGIARYTVAFAAVPVPNIISTNLYNLCGGGFATLNVGAVFNSYNWNTGATTQLITISSGGTYTVTVTNQNGCTGSSSIIVSSGCNIPLFPATPTTNITATTAMANWIQPICYNNYTIRICLHNTNTWTNYNLAPNTHYTFSGLLRNTKYDWQIQTNCNPSGSLNSGFSATQVFTTLARMEDAGISSTDNSFNVYPNPAEDQVTVSFVSNNQSSYNVRLMDVTGRIIMSKTNNAVIGENQFQFNLTSLARGVYMVILQHGDLLLQKKLVIQ